MALAVSAMDQASEIVRAGLTGATKAKGDRDMASDVDFRIERELREFLAKKAPGIGFLGEEEGRTGDFEVYWALDPVDGTANFVRDIPLCAVSLSLVQGKQAVLGVVDLPFLGGRYTAERGGGAYRTGRRLRASRTQTLHDAVVAVGDYAVGDDAAARNRPRLGVTRRLAERAQRVRMLGAVAIDLVWVAEGKLDASITLSNKAWDTAAGALIAMEAGAAVVGRDGAAHTVESDATIAVAAPLLNEVLALVGEAELEYAQTGTVQLDTGNSVGPGS
ncbi:MAG: inositol monophosphatase [Geodermatophilaceae bacterium]|nr:inositol monophosphatase [Geodermatophilaceae bacterium]